MQFARTGNPNTDETAGQNWCPASAEDDPLKVMNIDSSLNIIDLPEAKGVALWNELTKIAASE